MPDRAAIGLSEIFASAVNLTMFQMNHNVHKMTVDDMGGDPDIGVEDRDGDLLRIELALPGMCKICGMYTNCIR